MNTTAKSATVPAPSRASQNRLASSHTEPNSSPSLTPHAMPKSTVSGTTTVRPCGRVPMGQMIQ